MARPKKSENLRRETTTIRLPNWLLIWLLSRELSAGVIVEDALINHYDLKEPKE